MVNKYMRYVAKAAESAAMRLRSAAIGSRGDEPRDIRDHELDLIYSRESYGDYDTKKAATKKEPDVAKPKSTRSDSRRAMSLAEIVVSCA